MDSYNEGRVQNVAPADFDAVPLTQGQHPPIHPGPPTPVSNSQTEKL